MFYSTFIRVSDGNYVKIFDNKSFRNIKVY